MQLGFITSFLNDKQMNHCSLFWSCLSHHPGLSTHWMLSNHWNAEFMSVMISSLYIVLGEINNCSCGLKRSTQSNSCLLNSLTRKSYENEYYWSKLVGVSVPPVQGSSGGTEGNNRDSDSTAAGANPRLLTNEQAEARSDPIPPNPDQAVTHGPSSPRSLTSTQDTPPDQATPKDVHSGSELSNSADNTDLLSGLSQQQKKKLLEIIASDEHMRTELISMVGQQYPPASQEGSHPDLPHPLHHDIDTLGNINGATAVPVVGPNATASCLPGNSLPGIYMPGS